MLSQGVDACLLSVGPDLPWLVGYEAMPLERLTMLVVTHEGPATLVVPQLEVPRVVERPDVFAVQAWGETDDPIALVANAMGPARHAVLGDKTWATFLVALTRACPDVQFGVSSSVIGPLRAVKDPHEIHALRSGAEAVDRIAADLQGGRIPLIGRTEQEVSADIGRRLLEEGHHRVNFAIVASGPNSASPHHEPSARVIGPNEVVLCDFGGTLMGKGGAGYCSDITRCVFTGEPNAELREIYAVLFAAEAAGVAAGGPGVAAEDVDSITRNIIKEGGYGEWFVHRTGHGIGVEEHEDPYIVSGNRNALEVGNAYSVEPGIYLPGRFGFRLEDIVIVTPNGAEPLNHANRQLVSVEA